MHLASKNWRKTRITWKISLHAWHFQVTCLFCFIVGSWRLIDPLHGFTHTHTHKLTHTVTHTHTHPHIRNSTSCQCASLLAFSSCHIPILPLYFIPTTSIITTNTRPAISQVLRNKSHCTNNTQRFHDFYLSTQCLFFGHHWKRRSSVDPVGCHAGYRGQRRIRASENKHTIRYFSIAFEISVIFSHKLLDFRGSLRGIPDRHNEKYMEGF